MNRIGYSAILGAFALGAGITACNNSRTCDTSEDCFSDESCVGGTCLLDEGGVHRDAGSDTAEHDDSDEPDGFDPGDPTSCLLEPVDAPSCDDEYEGEATNNSRSTAYRFDFERAGCPEDAFVPAEGSVTATQCFDETEDWYEFQRFECENYQFRIQVDLVPAKNCETPLELRAFDCESENVRCETLEGGRLRQTRVIERASAASFRNQYLGVISTVADQQVDYSLSVKVYR